MKTYLDVAKTVATLALMWMAALVGLGFTCRLAWYFVAFGWRVLP